jgi:uncharacterized protein YprB with RNaseH-like and TPR domain
MDLKKRLAQLDRLSRRSGPGSETSVEDPALDPSALASVRAQTLHELDLRPTDTPAGPVWIREYRDLIPWLKGPLPDLRGFFTRAGDAGCDAGDILFLDTETTGLAGGTGTIPFLVGVSWWEKAALTTRQYFLPDPGQETAMLRELARLASGFRVVVTFNGASFDLPLLRTRARLSRLADPLADLLVWDLLVPARRLFGNRLPDCRQQTLEREICGLGRDSGDIDGSRIPQVWFDFLATGRAGLLPRVLTHNHRDMVGMGLLFEKVTDAAHSLDQGIPLESDHRWQDGWALGRICERRRDTAMALACLTSAVAAATMGNPHGLADPRFLSDSLRILKRGGDWTLVEQVIQHGFTAGVDEPWLHREAAILYEHRLVRPAKALDHALKSGEDQRVQRLQRMLNRMESSS